MALIRCNKAGGAGANEITISGFLTRQTDNISFLSPALPKKLNFSALTLVQSDTIEIRFLDNSNTQLHSITAVANTDYDIEALLVTYPTTNSIQIYATGGQNNHVFTLVATF